MKQVFFYSMVFLFVVVTGCKEDDEDQCCDPTNPECANYDPCFGKEETTAFFTIAQQYWPIGENSDIFIEDDIVTGGKIKFSAIPQEGATYTWILGADTIEGGPEIIRTLGEVPDGTYLNSLVVTKEPDILCFPSDDGVAEFSRSFTKIDGCDVAFLGLYKGTFASIPEDSVEIELVSSSSVNSIEPCDQPSNTGAIFSINFGIEEDTTRLYSNGAVNSQFSFLSLGTLGTAEGEFIYNSSLDKATAEYQIDDTNYSFTGRKIQ